MILAQQNILQAANTTLRGKNYVDACVMLNACTAPVAFTPRRVLHIVFLISLVLEQTSEDCIENTKHSNNKVVLEPRVSPAFAITYLCNHCNIKFENTLQYVDTLTLFSKNLNQRSLTPR